MLLIAVFTFQINTFDYYYSTNQRSKVKGTLEIYHAYISDTNGAINNTEADTEDSGWELLGDMSISNTTTEEQPAEVEHMMFIYKFCEMSILSRGFTIL